MEQPSKFQHQLQPDMPSSSTMSTSPHPEQTPPWGALWVLALGLAMIVLDSSIVNVSIPTIIDDIGIDLTDAQWVTSLYNIVLAALLLPFGKLGDAKGRKLVFQIGTVIFVASSLLAATSQDAGMLLTARALQGIGGAMIMPNTLSTVSATFRGKYRAAAFGVWGAVMSSAAALGPLLGGMLTETLGWRWIFLVNLPLGIIIFVATIPLVPKTGGHTSNITSSTASSTIRFQSIDVDIPGVVLSALTSALLVFGLIEGETYGWWKQTSTQLKMGGLTWNHGWLSPVPICLVAGMLLLVVFITVELARGKAGRPVMLDMTLFRIKTFSWGNLSAAAIAAARCGLDTGLCCSVGNDDFGRFLLDTLRQNGVRALRTELCDEAVTTMAFVTLTETGERSFTFARKPGADMFLRESDVKESDIREAVIVHAGSCSLSASPAAEERDSPRTRAPVRTLENTSPVPWNSWAT